MTDFEVLKRADLLVKKEQALTRELLPLLLEIYERRLYADKKYPSLFKFLTRHYGYSEAEAVVRVNAVKLMQRSIEAKDRILSGQVSLSKANVMERAIKLKEKTSGVKLAQTDYQKLFELTSKAGASRSEVILQQALDLPRTKKIIITVTDQTKAKLEKVRPKYGDVSDSELIDILLDEKIRDLKKPKREIKRDHNETLRHFSEGTKRAALKRANNKCELCKSHQRLELDHKLPYKQGGKSTLENVRVLCNSCNQREAIKVYGVRHMKAHLLN